MAAVRAIHDKPAAEAKRGRRRVNKKEAATVALQEHDARRKQARILRLFGTIDYDESYDY